MKSEDLQKIVTKAESLNGDINDAICVVAAMFESTSRHLKEIKMQLKEIKMQLNEIKMQQNEILSSISERLDKIEQHTTDWVYRAIVED